MYIDVIKKTLLSIIEIKCEAGSEIHFNEWAALGVSQAEVLSTRQ